MQRAQRNSTVVVWLLVIQVANDRRRMRDDHRRCSKGTPYKDQSHHQARARRHRLLKATPPFPLPTVSFAIGRRALGIVRTHDLHMYDTVVTSRSKKAHLWIVEARSHQAARQVCNEQQSPETQKAQEVQAAPDISAKFLTMRSAREAAVALL